MGKEESFQQIVLRQLSVCVCVCVCVRVRTHVQSLSHVRIFATLWMVAGQAPLSVGFFRQEHWSGLPFPPPGDLPHPGMEPMSLMSPASAGRFFTTSSMWISGCISVSAFLCLFLKDGF